MAKNRYKILKDYAIIYLDRRNKSSLECKISLSDLDRILSFPYKWYALWYENTKSYYAKATIYLGVENGRSKSTAIFMQRYIMDADKETIDHRNHDTLDNRRENLRVTEKNKNSQNRKSKNSNNKSGYRNVCWDKIKEKWMIQLQINGKNKRMGHFDNVHEAGAEAERLRRIYYKEYAGNN